MAEWSPECPPRPKKQKRMAPLPKVNAEERAKQFKEDLYANEGMLFCKFCEHSVDLQPFHKVTRGVADIYPV